MTHKERLALRRAQKREAKLTENLTPTEMDSIVEDESTGKVDVEELMSEILVATTAVQTVLERIERLMVNDMKVRYGVE
jgi:hypothetical protein